MKILIAEDDLVSRSVLERCLKQWGHEVIVTCDGNAAWQVLQREDAPKIALLDWMMPGLDGPALCRRAVQMCRPEPTYLILVTAKQLKEDIVQGLESGANDFVAKPFDHRELQSRLRVAERQVNLQNELAMRVLELERALIELKQLRGLLPICSYCKKIRDDKNYWQGLETYLQDHSELTFSHGICPDCFDKAAEKMTNQGVQIPAGH